MSEVEETIEIRINEKELLKLDILRAKRKIVRFFTFPFIALKHKWDKAWIREDEFHSSLDMDSKYLIAVGITSKKGKAYMRDLDRRRQIAHERDLESE